MKKVLLTGSTGLIGKYAIEPLLEAGFEVFAVSTKGRGNRKEERENLSTIRPFNHSTNINWIQADLLNFSDIKRIFEEVKPDYLLHFAWDTRPGIYLEDNSNFDWLKSSLEMLKQFKAQGGKRAVFAGTCFEYEFEYETIGAPLKEDAKLNPTSTYAKCKNHLRELSELYSAKNDLSFGWGRIFYVYGENEQEKRLIPFVIKTLSENNEFKTSSGDLIKDYMFAGDIAGAFVKFLDSNVEGCVNICAGIPVTVADMALTIARKIGKEHLVKLEPKPSKEPGRILGDNTRLTKEVGFVPKYSLSEGIDIVLKRGNND